MNKQAALVEIKAAWDGRDYVENLAFTQLQQARKMSFTWQCIRWKYAELPNKFYIVVVNLTVAA